MKHSLCETAFIDNGRKLNNVLRKAERLLHHIDTFDLNFTGPLILVTLGLLCNNDPVVALDCTLSDNTKLIRGILRDLPVSEDEYADVIYSMNRHNVVKYIILKRLCDQLLHPNMINADKSMIVGTCLLLAALINDTKLQHNAAILDESELFSSIKILNNHTLINRSAQPYTEFQRMLVAICAMFDDTRMRDRNDVNFHDLIDSSISILIIHAVIIILRKHPDINLTLSNVIENHDYNLECYLTDSLQMIV